MTSDRVVSPQSDGILYDGLSDPPRRRRYRREVARAGTLGAFGVGFVAIVGFLVAERGVPARSAAFAVFGGAVLLFSVTYLLGTRGARDSLRIWDDRVELPTRTTWDAVLGRPNEIISIESLSAVYVPPPSHQRPFVGFERKPGEILLVGRSLIGDLNRITELLKQRGVRIVPEAPPAEKIVWPHIPWWVRRPSVK